MTTQREKLQYSFRLYVVSGNKRLLGKGGSQILDAVDRLGSISAAANELQMSYRFVWNYLRRMEQRLGRRVIATRRGGTKRARGRGGGGAELTLTARTLLNDYKATEAKLEMELASKRISLPAHHP